MPQMMNWLHANVIYPSVVRARGEGRVFAALGETRRAERQSPEALRAAQDARLREIVAYAREHSPFYRERWPEFGARSLERPRELLATLPLVRKADVQARVGDLRAQPAPSRVMRKITGGSTGEAVTIYKDADAVGREMAASWMGYGWFGIEVGDRAARFWGSPHSMKRRLRFAAADFAMHRVRFSAFAFGDEDLERYWRRCLSFRPQWFYGYVSMLEEFARFVRRRGYDGRALELKAIVTTSEVLGDPQRRLLSEVFGTRVQNEYGCGEVGPIAYECPEGSLHVMSENLVVELLTPEGRPAGEGESGEIVVTDLNNRAMPLVRYGLADFGVWGAPCRCGRPFPVLDRVWGRQYDFVQGPDGRRYHGEFLMYAFEDLRGQGMAIRQFQVTQNAADRLDVAVVLGEGAGASGDAEQRIARELEGRMPGMQVAVQRVETIERAKSGKMRVIVNNWLRDGAAS